MHTLSMPDIKLRAFGHDDIDDLYLSWFLDNEITKHLYVRHTADDLEKIKLSAINKIENPNEYFFIITNKKDQKIGTISLQKNPYDAVASFGYFIGSREYWGGPYALQAQLALFDFAFGELKLRRLWADAISSNLSSLFNFKRIGFQKEGVRRQAAIDSEGNIVDAIEFGLLSDEWLEIRQRYFEA